MGQDQRDAAARGRGRSARAPRPRRRRTARARSARAPARASRSRRPSRRRARAGTRGPCPAPTARPAPRSASACARSRARRSSSTASSTSIENGSTRTPGILRDVLALEPIVGPDLKVLFVGINPSLRSAEVGHHFARPGNRFYPALHAAGFTPRQLRARRGRRRCRATASAAPTSRSRPTRAADELSRAELRAGAQQLEALVDADPAAAGRGPRPRRLPHRVRAARRPTMGLQEERIGGRPGLDPAQPERPQRPLQARRLRAPLRRGPPSRRAHDSAADAPSSERPPPRFFRELRARPGRCAARAGAPRATTGPP